MHGSERQPPPDLATLAINGDRPAMNALWQTHRRWVAAVILANKPAEADLDDLLQDVAITLIAKIGTLSEPGSLVPWLRIIALNTARLAGRRTTTARSAVRHITEGLSREEGVEDGVHMRGSEGLARRDEAGRVLKLAMQLPEDYREPLLLRCMQDLSYRQISAIMGLPETTIETRIARARRMLRERVVDDDRRSGPRQPAQAESLTSAKGFPPAEATGRPPLRISSGLRDKP